MCAMGLLCICTCSTYILAFILPLLFCACLRFARLPYRRVNEYGLRTSTSFLSAFDNISIHTSCSLRAELWHTFPVHCHVGKLICLSFVEKRGTLLTARTTIRVAFTGSIELCLVMDVRKSISTETHVRSQSVLILLSCRHRGVLSTLPIRQRPKRRGLQWNVWSNVYFAERKV